MRAVSDEFMAVMTMLGVAFRVEASAHRISLYADQLSDLSIEQLKVAASRAVQECKFFPTVAELRRFVFGAVEDRALVAWAGLMQASSRVGAYRSVRVEDGAAAMALSVVFGSWPEFCAAEDGPSLAMARQEFLAAYRQFSLSGMTAPRVLMGWSSGDPAVVLASGIVDHGMALHAGVSRAMELQEGQ